jgi:D-tyrosyl-tRNA(Tyr) deacylase
MIGLIQRVSEARVEVAGEPVGAIGTGLLALVGVVPTDTEANASRLAERLLGYRVFEDSSGRMNLSVRDIGGGVLAVPQFTLAADTRKGTRPSFSGAAAPAQAEALYEALLRALGQSGLAIGRGRFGADMQVSLTNQGPVTLWLEG